MTLSYIFAQYFELCIRTVYIKLPNVTFSSDNDRPPLIRAHSSHILSEPHLTVLSAIKHSNDIWIRWGFPLIPVCVELQDPSLSSPPQDPLIGSWKDERESGLFSSPSFFFFFPLTSPPSFNQSFLPPLHLCSVTHSALTCSCSPLLSP